MKIHELLQDPKAWTQAAAARNADGSIVNSTDPTACSWCLFGAVNKCYPISYHDHSEVVTKLYDAVEKLGYKTNCYIHWNDDPKRTHEEVLALCKELDI